MKRRVMLSIIFGLVFMLSAIIAATYAPESKFEGELRENLFSPAFWLLMSPIVVIYCVILLVQAGLSYGFRRWRKVQDYKVSVWEFLPCMIISVLILSTVFSKPASPEEQFRRFVADKVPPSVSNIKCWQSASFSGRSWVVSFNLAPEDLDAVLSRYPYEMEKFAAGYESIFRNYPIEPPDEPMVYCYSYSSPPSERPRWMNVYVNEAKTRAYVIGGYD